VIFGRAEQAAVIVTTNLPFSEWNTMFSKRAALQSDVGAVDGPGAHHRHRERIVQLPAVNGGEEGREGVNELKPRHWFQAGLRWAVLEEGVGLVHWREAEHIFLSEDREAAFQKALRNRVCRRVLC
jgi:hypothetical protein